MRGINIPAFPQKIEIRDFDYFFTTRLSTKTVMWPEQALPLLCYICFPNDEAARDGLLQTLLTWEGASVPLAVPTRPGRVQADWLKVADIFHLYCDLVGGRHQKRRGGPSIGKAITLVSANAKSWGTGKSRLWDLWTDYKDVAHLVTAASLVCAEVSHRFRARPLPEPALSPTQFQPFQTTLLMPDLVLAVAMDFQRLGLAIETDGRREPVLDPDTLWRIPTDIDLNIEPIPLPVRKLTANDRAILQERRAGKRGRVNPKDGPSDPTPTASV